MATIEDVEIPGIIIDLKHLAEGIYNLMLDHPDSAALRFGMLLNDVWEPLEKSLKEKIPDHYLVTTTGEVIEDGKYYRNEVLHAISSYCFKRAKEDNILVV